MPDQDRIDGAAKNMGGKAKELAGKVTGDEKLKAEGKADQVSGKVQNAVGGIKDSLRDDKRRVPSGRGVFVRAQSLLPPSRIFSPSSASPRRLAGRHSSVQATPPCARACGRLSQTRSSMAVVGRSGRLGAPHCTA
jgi:uncharacterized protein YjbJ (UPF0337 family)